MKKILPFVLCVLCALTGCAGPRAAGILLSITAAQAVDDGQSFLLTAFANGGVKWSLTGPGALGAQTATSVTYSAPGSGTGTATITATSIADPSKSATLVVTVNAPLAITTTSLPSGTKGTGYNQTIAASGGTGALTFTISGGSLPAGLTLSSAGAIAGTPTALGSANFTVKVSDSSTIGPQSATQVLDIIVNQAPAITSVNTVTFVAGTTGAFPVTATGSPAPSLTESGPLPSGVTFTDNGNGTGTLGGIPATGTGKTYPITFIAGNGVGSAASQSFTLTVDEAPTITSANTATFTVGTSGSFTVMTAGFPASTLTETGALPSGVTFAGGANGTGTLSGTPASGSVGTYSITFTASNGVGMPATQTFTLTVGTAPVITSASSTTFTVGTAGTFTVTGTGTPVPSLTEVGALPSGVTFVDNGNGTGTLAGTPATGTGMSYSITFKATNSGGSTSQNFTLAVDQAPAISSSNSTTFTVGTAGSFTVTTVGFPTAVLTETGALPSGVAFVDNHNRTATLSGTPVAGTGKTYTIAVTATNSLGSATQNFTLMVNEAPAITSASSTAFAVGAAGTFTVTTTGFPVPSLIGTGALPAGVTFKDNANGTATLSGTPAAGTIGSYPITFTASNGIGSSATQSFALTVGAVAAITSARSTTFTVGTVGTSMVTTTGTPTPSLTETGALPSGVTFTDNKNGTGTLAGTPAVGSGKTYSVTFTASNGVGSPVSQSFVATVNEAPAFTSRNSTAFILGTSGLFAVLTTGFPAPSLTETGALPGGVTFTDNGNGSGKLAGIATTGAGQSFPITFTASNGIGSPATQSFTLTVDQAPAITSPNNTTFTVGTTSTFSVTTAGTPTPTLTETGALPTGVTFADNGKGVGTLSGTPAAGTTGTYSIVLTATNGVGAAATQTFTLTVNAGPAITSASSATFTVGTPGAFSVTATGTPTPSLTETGALPSGVTFLDNHNGTATLSGTPAAGAGKTYSLTFSASNGVGSPVSQTFTLTVNQAPAITSLNGTTFTEGSSGSFTVSTTGFPAASLTETGTLPGGVTFTDNHNGTGTLAGTPATGTAATYSLTFTASNGLGTAATQAFTLTVNPANAGPSITSAGNTTFTVGTPGTFSVTTTGTPTPTLTETGALPSGVTFRDNGNGTGTLSGTPAAGTGNAFSLTFTASNGVGSPVSQTFALTVNQAPAITSPSSTTFNVGGSASFTVLTTGFPAPALTETGALPVGVTFKDNGNGTATLSGTPASGSAGSYSLSFTASNGVGSPATQTFVLTVTNPNSPPTITSASSTTFIVGTVGTFSVTTAGTPTPSLTETGALPGGVTFKDNGNGTATLSGTPAAGTAATYPLTLTATNGVGTAATQNFTLTVSAGSTVTCGSGHESVMNGQYAFFFQGFNANGPVAVAGTFSADGTGKVALLAGVEDINTSTGVQTNVPINPAGSSYSVGSDNRGCLMIAAGSRTSKYAFSLGSLNTSSVAARGRIIEVDSTGTLGSGVLRLQDPTAFPTAINGSFVFDVTSTLSLSTTTPNRFAMIGSLTASGGVITSGEADFNLSGSVDGGAAGPLTITGGSYSVASNGRGTLTFDVSGAGTFNESIYIVSATEFYLMAVDAQSPSNPISAGTAHAQTLPLTTSSLSGNSVFYSAGLCACGPGSTVAPDLSIGVINVSTAGSFTLAGDQNQGGVLTAQSLSGTYTVDSAGRVVLQSGASAPYILYLESANRGFLLTTGNEVGEGFVDPQKGSPFTNASLGVAISFGTTDQTEQNVSDSSGVGTFDGLGTVSGTTDSASLGLAPSSNAFSHSYSVTNGTGTPGRGTITSSGATVAIFYIISTTKIVMMDVNNNGGAVNPSPAITIGRQ